MSAVNTWMSALVLASMAVTAPSRAQDIAYEKRVLVRGLQTHGINGLVFGKDGLLYGSAMLGTGIIRVDVKTGKMDKIAQAQPSGDDLAFAPDGALAWTALRYNEIRLRTSDGIVRTLATDLPWINPIVFDNDGMMYAGQVTQPDTLLAIDTSGRKPIRKIGEGYGGINAFELDGKGNVIAPLTFKGEIARINLTTGKAETLVPGLGDVVALRTDHNGHFYAVEWGGGRVLEVFPDTGKFRVVANIAAPLDNLAIGPGGLLYVSRPADDSIFEVDPKTGNQRVIVQGGFAAPGGLVVTEQDGKPALLVADIFGYRTVDPDSGKIAMLPFNLFTNGASTIAVDRDLVLIAHVLRGSVTAKRRGTGEVVQTWTSVRAPMAVALSNGKPVVVDYDSGEVVELGLDSPASKRVLIDGLQGPVGLAARPDGGWIVSEASTGKIIAIDGAGRRYILAKNLVQPEGIALMPDGAIAVAEAGARRLSRVSPTTGTVTAIAQDLPIGDVVGRGPVPVHLPTGVAVDARGVVYLTADVDNSIIAFTPRK